MTDLEIGQIWALAATPQIPPQLVVIGRIYLNVDCCIASISTTPHPKAKADGWPAAAHIPIRVSALEFALDGARLVQRNAKIGPAFEKGRRIWMEQFQLGKAGAFFQKAWPNPLALSSA